MRRFLPPPSPSDALGGIPKGDGAIAAAAGAAPKIDVEPLALLPPKIELLPRLPDEALPAPKLKILLEEPLPELAPKLNTPPPPLLPPKMLKSAAGLGLGVPNANDPPEFVLELEAAFGASPKMLGFALSPMLLKMLVLPLLLRPARKLLPVLLLEGAPKILLLVLAPAPKMLLPLLPKTLSPVPVPPNMLLPVLPLDGGSKILLPVLPRVSPDVLPKIPDPPNGAFPVDALKILPLFPSAAFGAPKRLLPVPLGLKMEAASDPVDELNMLPVLSSAAFGAPKRLLPVPLKLKMELLPDPAELLAAPKMLEDPLLPPLVELANKLLPLMLVVPKRFGKPPVDPPSEPLELLEAEFPKKLLPLLLKIELPPNRPAAPGTPPLLAGGAVEPRPPKMLPTGVLDVAPAGLGASSSSSSFTSLSSSSQAFGSAYSFLGFRSYVWQTFW